MKKVFALALVAGVMTFAACKSEEKKEETTNVDSTATMTQEAPVADSSAMATDSSAMATDTTKK